jgi:phosphorylase kinase alpha/beta subunit
VASISPYITSILVAGKQITIGNFAGIEHVIDHPLTPKEMHSLIYDTITDPYEAVLQQEIALYVGRLVSTTPQLFQGILKIRIGFVIQAMKLYLQFKGEKECQLESLSPSQIRKLLYRVLTDDALTMQQKRQIEGALCRVPRDFYDRFWDVLKRLPGGILIAGQHLPAHPTLSQMTPYELNFALLVGKLLGKISSPQYRQINVELLMILYHILYRNPELYYPDNIAIDLDKIIVDAINKYKENREKCGLEEFYCESNAITTSYLSRTVLDCLLCHSSPDCKIS